MRLPQQQRDHREEPDAPGRGRASTRTCSRPGCAPPPASAGRSPRSSPRSRATMPTARDPAQADQRSRVEGEPGGERRRQRAATRRAAPSARAGVAELARDRLARRIVRRSAGRGSARPTASERGGGGRPDGAPGGVRVGGRLDAQHLAAEVAVEGRRARSTSSSQMLVELRPLLVAAGARSSAARERLACSAPRDQLAERGVAVPAGRPASAATSARTSHDRLVLPALRIDHPAGDHRHRIDAGPGALPGDRPDDVLSPGCRTASCGRRTAPAGGERCRPAPAPAPARRRAGAARDEQPSQADEQQDVGPGGAGELAAAGAWRSPGRGLLAIRASFMRCCARRVKKTTIMPATSRV